VSVYKMVHRFVYIYQFVSGTVFFTLAQISCKVQVRHLQFEKQKKMFIMRQWQVG